MAKISTYNTHYDEDPDARFHEFDTLFGANDGSVARASESTIKSFLNAHYNQNSPKKNQDLKLFMLEDQKPTMDLNDFAHKVANKVLHYFCISNIRIKTLNSEKLLEKLSLDPQSITSRKYNLPTSELAMDIMICDDHCRKEFENYVTPQLAELFTRLSEIKHFEIDKSDEQATQQRARDILPESCKDQIISSVDDNLKSAIIEELYGSKPKAVEDSKPVVKKEIGIYPADFNKKPFIGITKKLLDGRLTGRYFPNKKNSREERIGIEGFTYKNKQDFACIIAARMLDFYDLFSIPRTKLDDNKTLAPKLVKNARTRKFKLPETYLAMDVLICGQHCRDEFKKYIPEKLAGMLTKLSAIKHFKVRKGKKEQIDKRAEEILLPLCK